MSPQLLTLVQGVLASLLIFLGAFLTAKIGAKSTKHGQDQQHEINWFEKLSARIDTLEQSNRTLQERIEKVEGESRHKGRLVGLFGDFLDELSLFVLYGRLGPYPRVSRELADYYDVDRWDRIADQHDASQDRTT